MQGNEIQYARLAGAGIKERRELMQEQGHNSAEQENGTGLYVGSPPEARS